MQEKEEEAETLTSKQMEVQKCLLLSTQHASE